VGKVKKTRITIAVFTAIIGIALLTSGAFAYSVNVNDTIYLYDGPGTTGGGEFKASINKQYGDDFRTFCLEKTEYISYNVGYNVANISDYAEGGAGGAVDGKDDLDPMTAYLYYHFAIGDLSDYDYNNTGVGRATSANALQTVIWYIEKEIITTLTGQAQAWWDEANGAWDTIRNVRVMNLQLGDVKKQSQLVLVPEPTTILLLGFGLLGLGLARRKS
jgi:hypothetical protein